jgi:hypothetical protein
MTLVKEVEPTARFGAVGKYLMKRSLRSEQGTAKIVADGLSILMY